MANSSSLLDDLSVVDLLSCLGDSVVDGIEVEGVCSCYVDSLLLQRNVNVRNTVQFFQYSVNSSGTAGAGHGNVKVVLVARHCVWE